MNTHLRHLALGALALAATVAAASHAQAQSKVGTSMGQFLLSEPSARVAGMGNAAATAHDEVLSAYFNAAGIGYLDKYAAQFTHARWFADISYDHAAVAIPLGADRGSVVLSLTSLNSGDIEVRTVNAPLGTGERYSVSDVSFSRANTMWDSPMPTSSAQLMVVTTSRTPPNVAVSGVR